METTQVFTLFGKILMMSLGPAVSLIIFVFLIFPLIYVKF